MHKTCNMLTNNNNYNCIRMATAKQHQAVLTQLTVLRFLGEFTATAEKAKPQLVQHVLYADAMT